MPAARRLFFKPAARPGFRGLKKNKVRSGKELACSRGISFSAAAFKVKQGAALAREISSAGLAAIREGPFPQGPEI